VRLFAFQAHAEGLSPYMVFDPPRDHGDATIANVQDWLRTHHAVANPIAEMMRRSGLAERTFKRRFTEATGLAPIAYVQRLRIEEAKRRLERTRASVDEISWQVGYEDPAFFRRLFRRVTQLSPGDYRKRFAVPAAERGSP
jgi:transcriptional regulator GlxA family with amidase domain